MNPRQESDLIGELVSDDQTIPIGAYGDDNVGRGFTTTGLTSPLNCGNVVSF